MQRQSPSGEATLRGFSVDPPATTGTNFRSSSLPPLRLSLSCLARRLESEPWGLSRVLGRGSYRALPSRQTLDGPFANCIQEATMFEERFLRKTFEITDGAFLRRRSHI